MVFQRAGKFILFCFVFLVLVAAVFVGVQWFSDSLRNMLIQKNTILPASLQTITQEAQASLIPAPLVYKAIPNSNNVTVIEPTITSAPQDVLVGAESVISVRVSSGQPFASSDVLFQKNSQEKLPIASLTKLMTALVVLENNDLSQKVKVDAGAMAQEGEQGELKLGQVFSVEGLLYSALMESNNRAAYQLSEIMGTQKFIDAMNVNARNLGMLNTHFQDTTGLDWRSYSTAQDLATLTQYLFEHYPLFKKIISLKEYDLYLPSGVFHHKLINTNILLGTDHIVGGKTGFTNTAKGCFMAIQNNSGNTETLPYVISIVLGSDSRFSDMQKVLDLVDVKK